MRTFAARLRNNGINKFIEKTEIYTVQEASTEKNKIYREALISLEIRVVSGQAEKYIINYTMKSLILAQDER